MPKKPLRPLDLDRMASALLASNGLEVIRKLREATSRRDFAAPKSSLKALQDELQAVDRPKRSE